MEEIGEFCWLLMSMYGLSFNETTLRFSASMGKGCVDLALSDIVVAVASCIERDLWLTNC